jgi:UDP-GlcNAc3NAcA epimerase
MRLPAWVCPHTLTAKRVIMKVLSAVGARPQFIKAAPVSAAFAQAGIEEVLVHSGQHYDHGMSQVFFEELGIPQPQSNLGVGSGSHGRQTGEMLERFEAAILEHRPDWVLVHGDTNSTLAAALAAAKLQVKVAHNEAGLRSFNRSMPEEHNRVLTDHCADLLFCPSDAAADQLGREGVVTGVHVVGDVMYDAALYFSELAEAKSQVLQRLGLVAGHFLLATLHRPYNVDVPERLAAILRAFAASDVPIVLPCHPRLRARLIEQALTTPPNLRIVDPVGYLDMLTLEKHARLILTDSGGVQKEAYFYGVPCLTLRPETEWTETVGAGWNRLVDADEARIVSGMREAVWPSARPLLFGDGHAAQRMAEILIRS